MHSLYQIFIEHLSYGTYYSSPGYNLDITEKSLTSKYILVEKT